MACMSSRGQPVHWRITISGRYRVTQSESRVRSVRHEARGIVSAAG